MDMTDILIPAVFPEFVAIPQLDIGEVIAAVILQRGHIQGLVLQKAVVPCAGAPVAVAAHDDLRMILRPDDRCVLQCLIDLTMIEFHGNTSLSAL